MQEWLSEARWIVALAALVGVVIVVARSKGRAQRRVAEIRQLEQREEELLKEEPPPTEEAHE